jgi:hypothetical protein
MKVIHYTPPHLPKYQFKYILVCTRVLGKKFYLREEVREEWKKLGNEELHNLYPSQNLIREVKTGRTER